MQLYDVNEVARIESTDTFQADLATTNKHKITAQKTVQKKFDKLILYAKEVKIDIPTIEKNRLIEMACNHYNERNSWKEYFYWATPSSDKIFLKRITINYLRHQCTHYDEELMNFYKKVGVGEAHDILKSRINKAIKQKYEWLK